MEIFKLFGSVMVDTTKANESLAKTDEQAEGLGKKLQSGIKTAGKWAVGITGAATAVGAAMVKTASATAAHADEIDKMSQKMGLSRKAYQEWDYVLSQAGVDINSMQTGLKTLTNKLDDAKNGSASATAMFEQLGLSLEDLQSMSREDVFEATIAGFQKMEDSTERAALANDLFGKSGQELTALFNESVESTQELIDKANELGMVMSDDAVSAGVDMTDAMDTMKRSLASVTAGIGAELMPIINDLLNWVIANMPKIQEIVGKVITVVSEGFHVVAGLWTEYLQPIFEGILTFLDGVFTGNWEKIFQGLFDIVKNIFSGLVELIKIPFNGIINLLNGAIDGFNEIKIPEWVPGVGGKGLNIPHIPMLAEGGTVTESGTVIVGERGAELLDLPKGATVTPLEKSTSIDYDKITESFIKALEFMIPQMQTEIVAPSAEDLFQVVRKQSAKNAMLGRPGIVV